MPHVSPAPGDSEQWPCFPLSFGQERLWFLEELAPGNASYHIANALHFHSAVDGSLVERSLNEVVRRHEALRTVIRVGPDGRPVQAVAPELWVPVSVVDVAANPSAERESEAARLANSDARRPFDLGRGPLLRATLLRLGGSDCVLVVTVHHIVADGWSLGILFRELEIIYGAFSAGRSPELEALPVQYADFAVWQRKWLQGEVLERQLAYWKERLESLTPLDLPADRLRPAVADHRGATHHFELSGALVTELKEFSRSENATLFMTLLAAFQALLFRYTGQADIAVGTPIAGRRLPQVERLIGLFVNTLVMRTDLSGDPTFRELLSRVREAALGAYEHQDLPFEKLVAELQPERDLSRNPLVQVAFQFFQEAPSSTPPSISETAISESPRSVSIEKGTSILDLSLSLWEGGDRIRGKIEFSTALFDCDRIERMAAHFETLLRSATADAGRSVALLSLLTPDERQGLLVARNETRVERTDKRCVHARFEAQAHRRPNAIAVEFRGRELSYGQLNREADLLAQQLRRSGVGPDKIVAIYLERSPTLVLAALAVLKSGGAYLPLDPESPESRLQFMLADSDATVVVTDERGRERVARYGIPVVCAGFDLSGDSATQECGNAETAQPGNLAYVIFTSGSAGQPKAVAVEHQALSNLVAWHIDRYSVTEADRATMVAAPSFDASVWEMWPYLAAGVSLHIPDVPTRDDPRQLVDWIARERITLCFLPTPLAELALEEAWPDGLALRALLTGGDRLRRNGSGLPFPLMNHYGPTENTVVTTCGLAGAAREGDPLPSIGQPIDNVEVYVLDRGLQPVPVGVPGELYIGGAGLARGYLNRPELTAESFIPHPFSALPGDRLYKTGDLVRYRRGGELEFLGRADGQVKVRGYRIEVGEIEAVLREHPQAATVVATVREDTPGDARLVAYVALAGNPEGRNAVPDRISLRTELRELAANRLPAYMIPSAFVFLDRLPLTAHGKVNREALPVPESGSDLATTPVGPRTPTETTVIEIWKEVLGTREVGVLDDFFRVLGGHSLLATRVLSRIRNIFRLEVPLRAFFEAPTVAALADRIDTLRWASESSERCAVAGVDWEEGEL
jgi:amino acid adenylation domain-containing protein